MPANPDLNSKNIPVINSLRGIAALLVCFLHFVSAKNYFDPDLKYISSFGRTGVYIFFVVSGVVIPLSMIRGGYGYRSWGNFMLKRLIRLEPPYLVCIVLALIYFQVRMFDPASAEIERTPPTSDILLHVGYLVPFFHGKWILGVFWTLAVEFQYYLVLSLLMPLLLTGSKAARYCFYLIFLCIPFLLANRAFFPVHAPYFLMGILYCLMQMNIIESRECFITTLLCIMVAVLVSPVSSSIAALLSVLIIHFLPNYTNGVLEFHGKISYSLYLLHQITGKALINLLSHKFREGYQKPFVLILGYIVAVISAYIFYRIIEKPSKRLSGKIKYNRTFIPFKKQDI